MDVRGDLPADHPGVDDPVYRARRAEIAETSAAWRPGAPLPDIGYTDAEHEVWRVVAAELAPLHRSRCAPEFLDGVDRLALPADRIPRLQTVSDRLGQLSGFGIEPVPGLVPTRRFYGSLGRSAFLSTQYLRHGSVPLYTPEPDVVHEVVGHCNLLANPTFAELHRAAGRCSSRCVGDDTLEFFSRVFWFTLEFGVVRRGDAVLAYGAGLASSFGELHAFTEAEIRPFDLVAMGTTTYDITHYQPVLFAVDSIEELADRLGTFFETFDDDAHARMIHPNHAA